MTIQLEARSASSHQSSGRAPLKFQWESFSALAQEIIPLFFKHSEELGSKHPLDLDWETYFRLEASGVLRVITARSDGVLVGYIIFMMVRSLHSKTVVIAKEDIYFLEKEFRRGGEAMKMFKSAKKGVKEMGASVIIFSQSHGFPGFERMKSFFKRLGFRPIATIYSEDL